MAGERTAPGRDSDEGRQPPNAGAHDRGSRQTDPDADAPDHLSPRSQVSGGGGETDIHTNHTAKGKQDRQASSEEKRHERDNRQ